MFPAVSGATGPFLLDKSPNLAPRERAKHGLLPLNNNDLLPVCRDLKCATSLLKLSLLRSRLESGKDKVGMFPAAEQILTDTRARSAGHDVEQTQTNTRSLPFAHCQAAFRIKVQIKVHPKKQSFYH